MLTPSHLVYKRFDTFKNSKHLVAEQLKLSYRTYASYINKLPPQIVFNGSTEFFVPIEMDIFGRLVFSRFDMGFTYTQMNNWCRVLVYMVYNCARFHIFNKGMNQMVKELHMNRAEAIANIEDLLARGVIRRVLEGYKNKSGFSVVSSYTLGDESILAPEFREVWRRKQGNCVLSKKMLDIPIDTCYNNNIIKKGTKIMRVEFTATVKVAEEMSRKDIYKTFLARVRSLFGNLLASGEPFGEDELLDTYAYAEELLREDLINYLAKEIRGNITFDHSDDTVGILSEDTEDFIDDKIDGFYDVFHAYLTANKIGSKFSDTSGLAIKALDYLCAHFRVDMYELDN